MENNVNYYLKSRQILDEIEKKGVKPTLLLHACCGPCATFPLVDLCPHFNVTIYFNNSNIYPAEEYYRRLEELKKFLKYLKHDYGYDVGLIVTAYDNDKYNQILEPLKDYKEGSIRCFTCYEKRMDEAMKYASLNGFDYFTTVMSVSRQKNSQVINQIGAKLSQKYPNVLYFYSDFKKNKGQDYARMLRIKYDLYNQLYCGCKYSYNERFNKKEI